MAASASHSDSPLVSVLALSYNHERFVEECLDAIASQTFTNFELVIVDDCSTDRTAELVSHWLDRTGFPATFIRNPKNLGVSAARNIGLSRAQGQYVCTAATDDVYDSGRLERQTAFFADQPPEVAAVFSDAIVIDEKGNQLPNARQRWIRPEAPTGDVFAALLRENFISAPATMMRRSAVQKVGGWDEDLIIDDWDLLLRLADRYQIQRCPGIGTRYRERSNSLSQDPGRAVERSSSVVQLLLKWIDRDRDSRSFVLARSWKSALAVLAKDRGVGTALLQRICEIDPTRRRRCELALASTAIGPPLVRAARTLASWRRRNSG